MNLKVVAASFAGAVFITAVSWGAAELSAPQAPAHSTVFVDVGDALGSGVYIGHNEVITAAHVVEDMKPDAVILVHDDAGHEYEADVAWLDHDHDIAELKLKGVVKTPKSRMSCSVPTTGDDIEIIGNPLGIQFVHTWGRVARAQIASDRFTDWKSIFLMDASIAPGNSGGPVFDMFGRVIGIAVAMVTIPAPEGLPPFGTGISIAVTGQDVCSLIKQHATKSGH